MKKQEDVFDWKHHLVLMSVCSGYAYCTKCMVTRQAKDVRHIAARECVCRDGDVRVEGDYCKVSL